MSTLHPWQLLVVTVAGWINRHQQDVIDYLVVENRVLKGQLRGRRLRLTDAERRYMDARYDHESALIKMAKMHVASTFDGYITELPYYTDNTPVDAAQLMARIMDYSSMYLEVNLPGKDLGTVKPGQDVNISNYALPDQMLIGQVNQVAPTLDAQSRSFKATITVE